MTFKLRHFFGAFRDSGLLFGVAGGVVIVFLLPGEWFYKAIAIAATTLLACVAAYTYSRRSRVPERTTTEVAETYQALLERWSSLVSLRSADRLLDEQDKYVRILARTPEGRAAVESLTGHPTAGVRVLSAHATYFWNQELAVRVLTEVAEDSGIDRRFRDFAVTGLRVLPGELGRAD